MCPLKLVSHTEKNSHSSAVAAAPPCEVANVKQPVAEDVRGFKIGN